MAATQEMKTILVRDHDGWFLRLRLGPRLWIVVGRWTKERTVYGR
jgi:hypothetical protein